jgi:hypothetical protein
MSSRIAGHNRIRSNICRDYTPCTNDGTITNAYARQDHRTAPNPYVIADHDITLRVWIAAKRRRIAR